MKRICILFYFCLFTLVLLAQSRFSSAGFYPAGSSNREVYNLNLGWRFQLGKADEAPDEDSSWDIVNLPHTVQLLPSEGSGTQNYLGVAWYVKHFTVGREHAGKELSLHFEGVMGKSRYYVNGKMVKEHFGGYLPVIINLTSAGVKAGDNVCVAVCADNSDDPSYPPGKPQYAMDLCTYGGIYRDCWLVSTDKIHVTDANEANQIAGGGVFVSYSKVSEKEADVHVKTHLANESSSLCKILLLTELYDTQGNRVAKTRKGIVLPAGEAKHLEQEFSVKNPALWHPDCPNLYRLRTSVYKGGKLCDAVETRIGIRSVEFKGANGLYINGKPFEDKLLGANRHQEYAYICNAVPNNLHWLDAKKLRDAGLRIIRSAHYPQDPAFMDACDELGLFVIVPTPGWQFWNSNPVFEERVLSDIRNMVRRDRNHPSVIMWEPILNETSFPESFARHAYETTHEEYPYPGCYAAIDKRSKGSSMYDVLYIPPKDEKFYKDLDKSCFTREYGDFVDDWNSHNSYSRAAREWGEHVQLRQAQHFAKKDYTGSVSVDLLYKTPKNHVGGTFWHPFDHQRGYHPDPFWGGLMDVFRQPKYSYYMMMSQRNPHLRLKQADSGPMVYIAHEMTPFSPNDIVVYTNCDSVRLIINEKDTLVQTPQLESKGIRHPPIVFKDAYDYISIRDLHSYGMERKCSILAEAFLDGKVVATDRKRPSKRNEKLDLTVDSGLPLHANGGDIVTVIASITDKDGHVKRLSRESVVIEVEGEGELVGDATIGANPRETRWGTVPFLIRTTTVAGSIRVKVKLLHPRLHFHSEDSIELVTLPAIEKFIYGEHPTVVSTNSKATKKSGHSVNLSIDEKKLNKEIKEVERQQRQFECREN